MKNKSIIKVDELEKTVAQIKKENLKIILVGGCFDVLHTGHIDFLNKAKTKDGRLIILLESDENVKIKKGNNRPINKQKDRAVILANLRMVNVVVLLPKMKTDEDYLRIINLVKPDVIALSAGDINESKKRQEAEQVGAKIKIIKKLFKNKSSSKVLEMIES